MTNPYYAGDAGNLARLTIPSMGQVEDPATQRAMQAILQWANRLTAVTQLLAGTGITLSPTDGEGIVTVNSAGGSPVLGYGFYEAITPANPITTWSQLLGNFAYTAGTDIAFPADSVSFFTVDWDAVSTSQSLNYIQMLLRSNVDGLISSGGQAEDYAGTVLFKELSASCSTIADTASALAPFPWNVAAVVGGSTSTNIIRMSILSLEHP